MRYLFLFLSLSILFPTFGQLAHSADYDSYMKVNLRMLGHELLLSRGDSLSRILPVVNVGEKFRLSFEGEFAFVPEELVTTIDSIVSQSGIATSYIVEVVECESRKVVYSYKVDHQNSNDIIPCSKRFQPRGCYDLLFTVLNGEAYNLTEEEPVKAEGAAVFPWIWGIFLIGMGLIGWQLLKKGNLNKGEAESRLRLGAYEFNPITMELIHEGKRSSLSAKESQLLHTLLLSANETVKRENLLNEVWMDEGDYIGRTLDVFISKLRKHLSADPSVKIMNIRGVGYKLLTGATPDKS